MAASPSESPSPPPPPPPPPINNNSSAASVSNGPTVNQTQDAADGAATTSTADGTKPWQRAWSVDEMRKGATTWSLASDAGMLHYLQEFSQKMISQTHKMEQKVDGLVHETKGISAKVHNTFNDFLMLSNTQFIENRVYDEEERKDEEVTNDETNSEEKEKTREELESEVIPKINDAITSGLSVVASAFETVEVTPEQTSDGEDDGNLPENLRPEPILELTDVYAHRKLPYFIGTREFLEDDLVGLAESDDDMASEPSVGSQEQSELTSESESGTVSGSSSASEESLTATESEESGEDDEEGEDEKVVVPKKKQKKETVQDESISEDESVSEDELFAAGGVEKSSQSKQDEDSDDESDDEQPKKSGAPLDFAAELAAKIGAKPPIREDSDQDNDGDNEQDWEESGRHDSEQAKDDLFSASVDTTSTVASKGSRKKKEKSKHKKSRSGSQASRDSAAVVAAVPPGDNEQSTRHDVDDQDDLFTSSIDTTSTHVSKASRGSRHKHKTKKKDGRSDSQLSNASSKSGKSQPDAHKTSDKSDSNLFGASPEGELFDDDMSSPFGKKGGMFSSGGGLFDEVNEDHDNQEPKSDIVPRKASKSSQDQDESDGDEVPIKPKPRTSSSGKKLPAGAVAIFGDHGPFGPLPVHSSEHHVEKNAPPAKKSEKENNKGGGLFSDEGDDIFTSSQSSSVASSIKPPVATKKVKSVDLFGDDDNADDDDDSLFGAKPAKKQKPKPQPSKKKLPAGAVSMFGASPPPLFSTSPTDNEPVKSVVASSSSTTSVKAPKEKEAGGLFDEEDMTDSFSSEKTAPSAVPAAVVPVAVKPKRKTNQISLFDDHEDEGDGDDLFASISPSKGISPSKNDKTSKPNLPNEETKPVTSKPTPKRSTISLFDDDDDDDDDDENEEDGSDIFNTKPPTSVPKSKEKSTEGKPSSKPVISSGGLFGSEDDPLFSEGKNKALPDPLLKSDEETAVSKPVVKPTKPIKSKMVIEPDDEANLFAAQKQETPSSDPLLVSDEEPAVIKPVVKPTKPIKSKMVIEPDDEANLFAEQKQETPSSDPLLVSDEETAVSKPVVKPTKPIKSKMVIEPDDEANLFAEQKQETPSSDPLLVSTQPVKSTKPESAVTDSDRKEDLFSEAKQKAPSTDPFLVGSTIPVSKTSKQETIEPSQDLFDEDNKEKDEEDGAKIQDKKNTIPAKTSKILAGAVPMFGGVDIFAGQKLGKAKRRQQVGGLFGEDEDDLFAAVSPPKLAPSVAPRTKPPKKPAVETPQVTKSSPVVQPKIPVQPAVAVPAISSADKDSNVGKLQKTLAFNPAAMLPGAVRPPKKEEIVTESSFDQSASVKTLESSGRDRARIRGKRRPPTRQARRTAAKESMDDTSLFGSDISTTVPSAVSEERLPGRGGKSSALFSDNNELFSSNSYKAPEKSDQSVETQAKTSKSDPLFNTTKTMTPSAVSFEDSIDGRSEDKLKPVVDVKKVKDDISKVEQEKPTSKTVTDSLFNDNTKDDPFSLSTEENLRTSQKVKVVDDDEDEDDLFKSGSRHLLHSPPPLDFDSEATTSGDFMIDRKPKPPDNDDLFSGDSKFDQDIFATLPTMDEEKTQKEKKKEDPKDDHNKDDKKDLEDKPKESDSKKTSMMDDLFGDSGSIFDDIPKKPKKKKKATASKEDNIFDETKDTTGDDDTSKVKTTKKTKGKKKVEKKGKSKISIFDDDSPNIFDDPLNATSK